MHQATMAAISAEQNRDMRQQAAAWRRSQPTRGAVPRRPARRFVLIARGARSQARQRQHGPATA